MGDYIGIDIAGKDDSGDARFVYPAQLLGVQTFDTGDIGVQLPGETDLTKVNDVIAFSEVTEAIKWVKALPLKKKEPQP